MLDLLPDPPDELVLAPPLPRLTEQSTHPQPPLSLVSRWMAALCGHGVQRARLLLAMLTGTPTHPSPHTCVRVLSAGNVCPLLLQV